MSRYIIVLVVLAAVGEVFADELGGVAPCPAPSEQSDKAMKPCVATQSHTLVVEQDSSEHDRAAGLLHRAELEEALSTCMAELGEDYQILESCMRIKGFSKNQTKHRQQPDNIEGDGSEKS